MKNLSQIKNRIICLSIVGLLTLSCNQPNKSYQKHLAYVPVKNNPLHFRLPNYAKKLTLRSFVFLPAKSKASVESLVKLQQHQYLIQLLNSNGQVIARLSVQENIPCEREQFERFQTRLVNHDLTYCTQWNQTIDLDAWDNRPRRLEVFFETEGEGRPLVLFQLLYQAAGSHRRALIDWYRLSPHDRMRLTQHLPVDSYELLPGEVAGLTQAIKRPLAPIGQFPSDFQQLSLFERTDFDGQVIEAKPSFESFEVIGPSDFAVMSVYSHDRELSLQIFANSKVGSQDDPHVKVCFHDFNENLDAACTRRLKFSASNGLSEHRFLADRGRLLFKANQALIIRASYQVMESPLARMSLGDQVRSYGVQSLSENHSLHVNLYSDTSESPIRIMFWPNHTENGREVTLSARLSSSSGEEARTISKTFAMTRSAFDRRSGRRGYTQLSEASEWIINPGPDDQELELSVRGSDGFVWLASRHESIPVRYLVHSDRLMEMVDESLSWHPIQLRKHNQVDDRIFSYENEPGGILGDSSYMLAQPIAQHISHPILTPVSETVAKGPSQESNSRHLLLKIADAMPIKLPPKPQSGLRVIVLNHSNDLVKVKIGIREWALVDELIEPGINEFLLTVPQDQYFRKPQVVRFDAKPGIYAFVQGASTDAKAKYFNYRHFHETKQGHISYTMKKSSPEQYITLNLLAPWRVDDKVEFILELDFQRQGLDKSSRSFPTWTVSRRHYSISSRGDEVDTLSGFTKSPLRSISIPIRLRDDVAVGTFSVRVHVLNQSKQPLLLSLSGQDPASIGELLYSQSDSRP